MISSDMSSPQPSLESGGWKPSSAYTTPIVNSVESQISANLPIGGITLTEASTTPGTEENTDWLQLARNAYNSSDSWMQINLRATWMRNIAHYRSEHASDSPIMSDLRRSILRGEDD